MTKVVYNACFGGFSLSDAAIRRYAELKGITLYPEKREYGLTTYWTVPPEKRSGILTDSKFYQASMEDRAASNKLYNESNLYDRDIERDDPILVRVVEELGEAANGHCASLAIEDVPSGSQYRIDEYDGNESVMTRDSYEWRTA